MRIVSIFGLLLLFPLLGTAVAEDEALKADAAAREVWSLPQELNDANVKVKFEVDSTWHMVYGEIKNTSGSIKLADPQNYLSVEADIHFPVKDFSTGWGMRDDSLYEHMAVEKYPEVVVTTSEVRGDCLPEAVLQKGKCEAKLIAKLKIRDVVENVVLPITIEKKEEDFVVSGKYSLKWASYNVEDPSILVAKVDPVVAVMYSLTLPAKKLEVLPEAAVKE